MDNLKNELTVFLITTEGEPNFNESYNALKNQKDVNFNLEIIKDYYPLSVAFQEMLIRCKTKYYIECFTPETEILMENNELKKINSLKIGDKVYSDNNTVNKISKIYKKKYNNEIVSVVYGGNSIEALNMTKNHPCFGIKKENKTHIINKYRHADGYQLSKQIELINAESLKIGDLLLLPLNDKKYKNIKYINTSKYIKQQAKRKSAIQIPNKIPCNRNFLRLIGYYLAEGNVCYRYTDNKPSGITFTFHKRELRYVREVSAIIQEIFNLKTSIIKIDKKYNATKISINSFYLGEFFKNFVGEKTNKKVADIIMQLKPSLQFNLFETWFFGDGHFYPKSNQYTVVTTCKNLVKQMYLILLRNNKQPIMQITRKKGEYNLEAYKISYFINKNHGSRHFIYDNYEKKYLAVPIKKIQKKKYNGIVYNLEVENNHSYFANFVKVHNCDSDMVLYDYAVKKMYDAIRETDDKHPFVCYRLRDVHLDFPLYGVKIYKYDDFKKYPYNISHPSCEVEQLDRMKLDGYIFDDLREDIIGEHSPKWTEQGIFERYYNLLEKFKLFKYCWVEQLPDKLLNIFQGEPTKKNMYALAGALASIYSDKIMDKEKDTRQIRPEFKRLETFMRKPTQCTLYMTSECNYKCDFCYRQYKGITKAPDMSPEMVNTLMQKFPSLSGVCICGYGNPTISPNLIPVLKRLKELKKFVGLITNGSLLEEKLPGLIGWYQPNYISVSLNEHTPELHEKVTKSKTYDAVIRGIKALVDSPIDAYVSAVVSTEHIERIPALIAFVASLGITTLHLHNILPHFDSKEFTNFWDLVLTDKHAGIIEEWKKLPDAGIVKGWPVLIDRNGGKQTCQFPFQMLGMDGGGNLSVCNSVYPCDEGTFGNIKEWVVWNSDKLNKFRDDFVNKRIDACGKCFRNWKWI